MWLDEWTNRGASAFKSVRTRRSSSADDRAASSRSARRSRSSRPSLVLMRRLRGRSARSRDRNAGASAGSSCRTALPDRAGAAVQRESKRRIRPPTHIVSLQRDVLEDALQIDGGDALAHPLHVQRRRIVGPHLAVVGKQERIADAGAERSQQPFTKRRRRRARAARPAAPSSPSTHASSSASGRRQMLFWNGYGIQRSRIQTHASRTCSTQASPSARSITSSKYR